MNSSDFAQSVGAGEETSVTNTPVRQCVVLVRLARYIAQRPTTNDGGGPSKFAPFTGTRQLAMWAVNADSMHMLRFANVATRRKSSAHQDQPVHDHIPHQKTAGHDVASCGHSQLLSKLCASSGGP
jgi:hypothetical protein